MDKSKDYFKGIYVGGEWRQGKGSPLVDINPWTMEEIITINGASDEDINDAYSSAEEAQKLWAAMLPSQRSEYMLKISDVIQARKDEFIDLLIYEAGSTMVKAQMEVGLIINVFKSCADLPFKVKGEIVASDIPGEYSMAVRQPLGVIGLISPWNFPGQLTARTLGPALAVGNGVVVKPSSQTYLSGGTIFASFFEDAGLPKGLVSILPGKGSEIGTLFVTHPKSSLISFTGSTKVGREVGQNAIGASLIKKTELELGGNSPFVVLDDADIDDAASAAVWGKFLHQGQICMAINRIIVHDKIYDEFVNKFINKVKLLKMNGPEDPSTFIGPIIDEKQLDKLLDMIEKAKEEGYKQVLGGKPEGLCLPPHVFVDVDENCILAKNEIFGPVAIIMRAKDNDDALRMANNTDRGLSSAVFTGNLSKGIKFARKVYAGMTHINNQTVNDSAYAPFGGEKNSGLGRFNGDWSVNAFTRWHWITIQNSPMKYPFSAS